MLANIPLLFGLLLIIIFSHCQGQNPCTKDEKPKSRNDCFAISVPNGFCCFKSLTDDCQFVERGKINSEPELDCGITEENYGKYEFGQYHPEQPDDLKKLGFETCGKNSPQKKEDCTDYSELSNSCCLFSKGDTKACLHIGRKYIGDFKKTTFNIEEGGSLDVECKSYNIIFNLYSFLLIVLLFL